MAEHKSMDISAHKATYEGFMATSKWVGVFIAIVLILMAIFLT